MSHYAALVSQGLASGDPRLMVWVALAGFSGPILDRQSSPKFSLTEAWNAVYRR